MAERMAPAERHQFQYNGRLIYEWNQTYSEINIFIPLPKNCRAKDLYCDIQPTRLKVGLQSNSPYINEEFYDRVIVSESVWTIEDGELSIVLQKSQEGESWPCALKGHMTNQMEAEEDKKRLLLERFQMEHAGFDFSGAEVTGVAPNPRTFLKEDEPFIPEHSK